MSGNMTKRKHKLFPYLAIQSIWSTGSPLLESRAVRVASGIKIFHVTEMPTIIVANLYQGFFPKHGFETQVSRSQMHIF